jgi:hypothetical protein
LKRKAYLVCLLAGVIGAPAFAADPPAKSPSASAAQPPAAAKEGGASKAMDHLDLDSTEVTGNRELPKVMVIVPWKHTDPGEVAGRPAHSLMDEVLKPIDRDVLRREMGYYDKLGAAKPESHTQPEN